MSAFDTNLDFVVTNWLFGHPRIMLRENNILEFKQFLYVRNFKKLTYQKKNMTTKLKDSRVKLILDVSHYSKFICNNKDTIVEDSTQWDY